MLDLVGHDGMIVPLICAPAALRPSDELRVVQACQVCASYLLRVHALATLEIAELSLDARPQLVAHDVAGVKAFMFALISPRAVPRCVRSGCLCTSRGPRQEEEHGANAEGRAADVVGWWRDFVHGWHGVYLGGHFLTSSGQVHLRHKGWIHGPFLQRF